MSALRYELEPDLDPDAFIDLLRRSGLAERRPVEDRHRVARMLAGSDLVVTARRDGALVGVSRAITDFAYCCYLSDLAVDRALQGEGIGRALVEETRARAGGDEVTLVLVAAPDAKPFYPKAGLTACERAFLRLRTR